MWLRRAALDLVWRSRAALDGALVRLGRTTLDLVWWRSTVLDLACERHCECRHGGTHGRLCSDARGGAHTGRRMDRVEVCGGNER